MEAWMILASIATGSSQYQAESPACLPAIEWFLRRIQRYFSESPIISSDVIVCGDFNCPNAKCKQQSRLRSTWKFSDHCRSRATRPRAYSRAGHLRNLRTRPRVCSSHRRQLSSLWSQPGYHSDQSRPSEALFHSPDLSQYKELRYITVRILT